MPYSIKSPAACKPQELENFKSLLLLSELEGEAGLPERIARAEWLAFQYDEQKQLIGIAALKRPVEGYQRGVFKKAGLLEQLEQYPLEFGWVVVLNEYHGKGVGAALLKRLVEKAGTQGMFTVARSSDKNMIQHLTRQGFTASGEPYSRRSHRYKYQVFLRPGSAPQPGNEKPAE